MPTIEELQEQIDKLQAEAAAHRKGKAEERKAREEAEAKLNEIAEAGKAAEEKLLREKGNIDEILARKEKEHQAQIEKLRGAQEEWQRRYERKAIDEALTLAASKGNAHDPSEVASLLRANVALDEKGEVYIKSGDGVMMNEKGERVGVDSFVSQWLNAKPHHVKPVGGGAGSQGGKQSASATSISREAFESKTPQEQREFIKSGGKLTD